MLSSKIYHPLTGQCLFCSEDTFWGDRPHRGGCLYERIAQGAANSHMEMPMSSRDACEMLLGLANLVAEVMHQMAVRDVVQTEDLLAVALAEPDEEWDRKLGQIAEGIRAALQDEPRK